MKNLTIHGPISDVDYWLPESIPELMGLVQQARDEKKTLSVRGAAHSFPMIKEQEQANKSLFIMLAYLHDVTFDRPNYRVKVQAGCHLGYDPQDPTGVSTLENSLLYKLDPLDLDSKRPDLNGWCLPDLGGISHQTIGGFIATGSSGGSTKFSFEDAIVAVDLVYYGHQNEADPSSPMGVYEKTVHRPADNNPDDEFFGIAFANLGMMGIITAVTFDCSPMAVTDAQGKTYRTFDVAGQEAITTIETCAVDLFSTDPAGPTARPDLQAFLQQTDYTRLIWWPQKDMEGTPPKPTERVVVWQAKRTVPEYCGTDPYVPYSPYQEVGYKKGIPAPAANTMSGMLLLLTMGADTVFTAIGQWPTWLENALGPQNPLVGILKDQVATNQTIIFQYLLDLFVTLDLPGQHQQFTNIWWDGIPMDNQMSDKLFPVWFTELWIPIEHTTAVMNELHAFYQAPAAAGEPNHAGTFCVEIYAAGRTDFWLSPAYQHDVVRIDIFWFANNTGGPVAYYSMFWNLLRKYNFRPHWGKYMPDQAHDPSWKGYLAARYPKWKQWNDLRQKMDPCQLLVSDYWRDRIAIPLPADPYQPLLPPLLPTHAVVALPTDLQSLYNKENNLYHPETEEQVVAFVNYAAANGLQVRVRGAAQSVQGAVFADGFAQDDAPLPASLNLQLDQFRAVTFDSATMEVTVGAGCNLGFDPFDPSGVSSETNGLYTLLAAQGWVLPNVPPVAHQTVAGYIATGSEGGSVTTSFSDQVMAIRLVDGTGQITTFRRSDDLDNPFYAVGVSMGLLGIVVSVTLACLPGFDVAGYKSVNVVGSEVTTTQDDAPYSFGERVDPTKSSLETMLRTTPYARLLWWPYSELRWLITWQAHPMTQADEPFVSQGPMPYEPHFPAITLPGLTQLPMSPGLALAGPPSTLPISTRLPSELVASVGFWFINNWPNWYKRLTTNLFSEAPSSPIWAGLEAMIEQGFPAFYKTLMSFYFSPDKPLKPFWDVWWKGLTIDTFEFSNKLFNLDYTELWIPLNRAQEVIAILDAYYKADGFAATEVYAVEISGAKASNFWLSPGYETDTIRINILHFADGAVSSADYYAQFWTLLYEQKIPFRPHWGRMLPPANGCTGAGYLAGQYPKLGQFKALRTKMDPKNVFLTSYWKAHLDL